MRCPNVGTNSHVDFVVYLKTRWSLYDQGYAYMWPGSLLEAVRRQRNMDFISATGTQISAKKWLPRVKEQVALCGIIVAAWTTVVILRRHKAIWWGPSNCGVLGDFSSQRSHTAVQRSLKILLSNELMLAMNNWMKILHAEMTNKLNMLNLQVSRWDLALPQAPETLLPDVSKI